ncbi:hypothetical protein [Lactococcus lactis]|uniref:hypothetical protein n=1 Tax=Lactococcus lactis TaxID=1358 RepID=UPI00315C56A0
MSFTPEQLNWMNQQVYNVDPNYNSKGIPVIGSVIPTENKSQLKVGDTPIFKGKQYKVVSTCPPDSNHAFTAFALAPMNGNDVDENNIVVVAGGTWPANGRALADAGTEKAFGLSPQYYDAENYVEELEKQGYNISQLSGYSQSAYMLKVGANNHIPTTVFNGWFNYDSLSSDEKKYMKAHPELFVNYRHTDDSTVNLNDGNNIKNDLGTVIWLKGTSHNISSWKFDKDGNVVDEKGNTVLSKNVATSAHNDDVKNVEPKIMSLKKMLSSGGVSGAQKIALETELVQYTARGLKDKAEEWYSNAVLTIKKLQEDAKLAEKNLISKVQSAGGPMMSASEAKQLYYQCAGQNRYKEEQYNGILNEVVNIYKKELQVAEQMAQLVEKTLASDQSLTQYFK